MWMRRAAAAVGVTAAVLAGAGAGPAAAGTPTPGAAHLTLRAPSGATAYPLDVVLTTTVPYPCATTVVSVRVVNQTGRAVVVDTERVWLTEGGTRAAAPTPYTLAPGQERTWSPGVTVPGGRYSPYVEVAAHAATRPRMRVDWNQPLQNTSGYC